ncbi:MAG: glycosyltransferase [Puniceicoccales bacterium]|jgi:glycosyltransferase involved in cell wall biosynthesis|nr:glycosyltransferase [Puniceicoccales bacterium]
MNKNESPNKTVVRPDIRCSFCIFTYNQERYIEATMKSALAQTYDKEMEIIISDDCSNDGTFEVVRRIAADYKGTKTIVLNRNEKNMGIAGNVNKCFELARGEWLVMSGGDDISKPERVATLMCAVEKDAKLRAICSEVDFIDEDGAVLKDRRQTKRNQRNRNYYFNRYFNEATFAQIIRVYDLNYFGLLLGAASAWHRDVFHKWGALPSDLAWEDVVLSCRARMLGKVVFLPVPLLFYRKYWKARAVSKKDPEKCKLNYARNARFLDVCADEIGGGDRRAAKNLRKTARLFRSLANWEKISFGDKIKTIFYYGRHHWRKLFVASIPFKLKMIYAALTDKISRKKRIEIS